MPTLGAEEQPTQGPSLGVTWEKVGAGDRQQLGGSQRQREEVLGGGHLGGAPESHRVPASHSSELSCVSSRSSALLSC